MCIKELFKNMGVSDESAPSVAMSVYNEILSCKFVNTLLHITTRFSWSFIYNLPLWKSTMKVSNQVMIAQIINKEYIHVS